MPSSSCAIVIEWADDVIDEEIRAFLLLNFTVRNYLEYLADRLQIYSNYESNSLYCSDDKTEISSKRLYSYKALEVWS